MTETLSEEIAKLIASHRVVLFMKGSRDAPRCGFSGRAVTILNGWLDDYLTVDVLARPEFRNGVKEYSGWPTIPQLFVDGRLLGGSDRVAELDASGELAKILGVTEGERAELGERAVDLSKACRCGGKSAEQVSGTPPDA